MGIKQFSFREVQLSWNFRIEKTQTYMIHKTMKNEMNQT